MRRATLRHPWKAGPLILPSMLGCDYGALADQVRRLEDAGADLFHLDVMDGHFVPNLSYGLPLVQAFRKLTRAPLDVHLMISNPEDYVERYVEAGADAVTVHLEATAEPGALLERIRAAGAAAGLAVNPPTPAEAVFEHLDACDSILVMSVAPGFGGQSFQPEALAKLQALRRRVGPVFPIGVDGGVNEETIAACAAAGADVFIAGSAVLQAPDYAAAITRLRTLAQNAVEGQPASDDAGPPTNSDGQRRSVADASAASAASAKSLSSKKR